MQLKLLRDHVSSEIQLKENNIRLSLAMCCVVKRGLVTLVVIMILKDTATFQILFIVSLFCA